MRGAKLGYQWHSKKDWCPPKIKKTRMHSSRMRTARLLTVSQHALPGGIPARGCTYLGCVPSQGGVPAQGCLCTCLGGGGTCSGTPPTVNRQMQQECIPVGCILAARRLYGAFCSGVVCSWGGGVCSWGVSAPGGCLLPGGVWSQGGICSGGCLLLGVFALGGCLLPGVSALVVSGPGGLVLGGCIPACTEADTLPPPPWTEFLTHARENITLAQLRCGR